MPKAKKGGSKQHSTLAWRHVDLPSEVAAQASAGGPSTTDADFWLGLDADADDFMGLQEVEGVQVRNEEGRVRFEVKGVAEKVDEVAEESAGEEASAEEEEVEKPKSTTTTKKEKAKAKQKERKEKLKATKLASAASGSTSKDAAADAAAASEGEEDDEATALKADFRLLSQAGEEEEFDGESSLSLPSFKPRTDSFHPQTPNCPHGPFPFTPPSSARCSRWASRCPPRSRAPRSRSRSLQGAT